MNAPVPAWTADSKPRSSTSFIVCSSTRTSMVMRSFSWLFIA